MTRGGCRLLLAALIGVLGGCGRRRGGGTGSAVSDDSGPAVGTRRGFYITLCADYRFFIEERNYNGSDVL